VQDGDPTAPVQEHPSLLLDLLLDAEVVVLLQQLAHTVVFSHLEVEFRVAVHYAALLHHALEWGALELVELEPEGTQ